MEFAAQEKPAIIIADTRDRVDAEGKAALLQTFSFQSVHPQLIHVHTAEFSAVCPGTGLPDIGVLDLYYVPDKLAVELKALKYYLVSYRNEGIFQEPVTDLIFDHLWRAMAPRFQRVVMRYNTRGGFDTTVTVERGDLSASQALRALAAPALSQQL
jgi:7-cyano-7-deazaguanine reductase